MPTLNRRVLSSQILLGFFKRQGRNNRAFYQSSRWHTLSRMYRKKYPYCVECKEEGRLVRAAEVDHIQPITQGGAMWDIDNLQSLCKHHHSVKTKKEQKLKV